MSTRCAMTINYGFRLRCSRSRERRWNLFQHLSSMSELLAQCRSDKPAEQRMRAVRTRTIFGMKLCGQKPGVIFQLDDFDQPPVRREPAQHKSFGRQLLTEIGRAHV